LRLHGFSPPAYTFVRQETKRSAGASSIGGFFIGWNMRLRLIEARAFYFREA
jgi:hypothetical protein